MKKLLCCLIISSFSQLLFAIKPIDLGLSILWADCNLYETEYNNIATVCCSWNGLNDYIKERYPGWRLPTKDEYEELINNCSWSFEASNGKIGYNIKGNNGNSLFFPAQGMCCHLAHNKILYCNKQAVYWSSTFIQNNKYGIILSALEIGYAKSPYFRIASLGDSNYALVRLVQEKTINSF